MKFHFFLLKKFFNNLIFFDFCQILQISKKQKIGKTSFFVFVLPPTGLGLFLTINLSKIPFYRRFPSILEKISLTHSDPTLKS